MVEDIVRLGRLGSKPEENATEEELNWKKEYSYFFLNTRWDTTTLSCNKVSFLILRETLLHILLLTQASYIIEGG